MMKDSQRLRDYVSFGSQEEMNKLLNKQLEKFNDTCNWINENSPYTDMNQSLRNLLLSTSKYIDIIITCSQAHISILALATRGIYEINLRTRDIVNSAEGLKNWHGEAVSDKIEVLEGIMSLSDSEATTENTKILETEISRLQNLRKKYKLGSGSHESAGNLAKKNGLQNEHKALFKLFSKLIHPSSYLVNDATASSDENFRILQMHAQLYALDTFSRIAKAVSLPPEKMSFTH